jgi:hypothetical protein
MPPRRKAEDSAACLALRGPGRSRLICEDWGHFARVQGAGIRFQLEQARHPCPLGQCVEITAEKFFGWNKATDLVENKRSG